MKNQPGIQLDEMFEVTYESWMNVQRTKSKGERKRRLTDISNHAEKMFLAQVWWPSFGHFANLNAEFAVRDFKDGWRYLDFAFITEGYKICIEVDGYGTLLKDLDRYQFADQLIRQNHLVVDGWIVMRFSYDDVKDKPRRCQQILQQLFGRLSNMNSARLSPSEKAIYDLACANDSPITPSLTASKLGIHRKTAARHLHTLIEKGLLIPFAKESTRIVRYQVTSPDFRALNL
ncbi:helix-turn-helix domain-containing protein [Cohnella mopanensis]|uniref:helix-turn-helix domain-containing protein n=1 Tax=Cohnella mopanensis TaxID=2911966 RepID=UPI001EF89D53|nr:helix-turn-helix domain-containing protein [Cohnella mopanensis]